MESIYLDSIDSLLMEWGKAAREDTIRLDVPPQYLGKIKGSTVRAAMIEPDDFEAIDSAISKLYLVNKDLCDLAGMIYIEAAPYTTICARLGKSKATISNYRKLIIQHTADYLNFR